MLGCMILVVAMLWSTVAVAADVVDATGRTVHVPDRIVHIVPAGPPASVLLAAIAPDLMTGWPSPVSEDARAMLSPDAAKLSQIPRLTGRTDVSDDIKKLAPDLIVDYGTVSPRYRDLAQATQQRTGIPTILLDGSLAKIPDVFRTLGHLLHREDRAETLARFAEALLALPTPSLHPKVLYARGLDGLTVAAPNTDVTEVFNRFGWRVLAPEGQGAFRVASIETIRALDPDMVIFADPAMSETIEKSGEWNSVRAVREGHALVAPSLPFGWVEEPPSVNRLLGLAWLSGRDPVILAVLTNAVIYGQALTPAQRDKVLAGVRAVQP
jgi:iron complex transport system substrate-binding protein